MLNKFGKVLKDYLDIPVLPQHVQDGTVRSLEIDLAHRTLVVEVEFAELVQREMLFRMEQELVKSLLRVGNARIAPRFSQERLTMDYYPDLVQELKRRDASLNGFLKDSQAVLEGKALTITLSHGGYEALSSRHIDRELAKLIQEEFDCSVEVTFGGTLTIESDSSEYIEKRKIEEEKIRRQSLVDDVEAYEERMERQGVVRTTQVRDKNHLLPTYIPETVRELYGRSTKAKPLPIQKVTPDAGSVTIWGEIFALDLQTDSG